MPAIRLDRFSAQEFAMSSIFARANNKPRKPSCYDRAVFERPRQPAAAPAEQQHIAVTVQPDSPQLARCGPEPRELDQPRKHPDRDQYDRQSRTEAQRQQYHDAVEVQDIRQPQYATMRRWLGIKAYREYG